jgi:hypothetical protein
VVSDTRESGTDCFATASRYASGSCVFCDNPSTLHKAAYNNPPPIICPSCRKTLEEATGCKIIPAEGYRVVTSIGTDEIVAATSVREALKKVCPLQRVYCIRNIVKRCYVFSSLNSRDEWWAEIYEPDEDRG